MVNLEVGIFIYIYILKMIESLRVQVAIMIERIKYVISFSRNLIEFS